MTSSSQCEQIRASHILVKSEQEAQSIQEQLKKGANFEELAKAKSADSSAAKGGDLAGSARATWYRPLKKLPLA